MLCIVLAQCSLAHISRQANDDLPIPYAYPSTRVLFRNMETYHCDFQVSCVSLLHFLREDHDIPWENGD